jgi:hypothetical protein
MWRKGDGEGDAGGATLIVAKMPSALMGINRKRNKRGKVPGMSSGTFTVD